MSYRHYREPIKHTCPDIDRYIKAIKGEIVTDRYLEDMNESELLETAAAMNSQLEKCINYLEDLRDANATLRQWGIDEATKVDNLEYELDEVKEKLLQ